MTSPKKVIPSSFGLKNLSALLLPARNYDYFEQASKYGFEPEAKEHSLVNAWWLAECSLLAYEDTAQVKATLDSVADLELDRFVSFRPQNHGVADTQGYGMETRDFAIICFRGTEFYSPRDISRQPKRLMQVARDIYLDAQVFPAIQVAQAPRFDVPVHAGFYQALHAVWDDVSEFIEGVGEKSIWATGHSLGGAIATLLTYQFSKRINGLYTYGSPCVGTGEFAAQFEQRELIKKTFRYVHGNDFVAKVLEVVGPRIGGMEYEHVGVPKYLAAEARKNLVERLWNYRIPLDQTDHAPLYYALHIWNRVPTV